MTTTPILMINENNTPDLKEYLSVLESLNSNFVTLRTSLSGLPTYRKNDLHMPMKYQIIDQMFDKNKSTVFFTTIGDMIENLQRSESEELIEVPMGYLINERAEKLAPAALSKYKNADALITTHDHSIQERQTVHESRKYHHAMTITHLHQFLMTAGALPIDQSSNWSGNERVRCGTVISNMFFSCYYRFKKMPREEAIRYVKSLSTGCPIIPRDMEISSVYHSKISILHTRPLYVPIRPRSRFFTYPNSAHRMIYLYDCIASWVQRNNNSYYYDISPVVESTGAPTGEFKYMIKERLGAFDNTVENNGITPPDFMKIGIFYQFKTLMSISPQTKIKSITDFFLLLGYQFNIQKLEKEDDTNEDYIDRSTIVDPLTDYRDYWVKQKSRRQKTLVEEILEAEQCEEDEKKPINRPTDDGYRTIPGHHSSSPPRNAVVRRGMSYADISGHHESLEVPLPNSKAVHSHEKNRTQTHYEPHRANHYNPDQDGLRFSSRRGRGNYKRDESPQRTYGRGRGNYKRDESPQRTYGRGRGNYKRDESPQRTYGRGRGNYKRDESPQHNHRGEEEKRSHTYLGAPQRGRGRASRGN